MEQIRKFLRDKGFALALLACSDAIRRISTHPLWRWLLHMQIAIIPLWLLYSGTLNDLSLMKEYANRQDVFDDASGTTSDVAVWCGCCLR